MTIVLQVSREDLEVIHQALNEICNVEQHIPDWEFQTRMGVTRDEARLVLEKTGAALDANPREP
jgi:hypothetical protein